MAASQTLYLQPPKSTLFSAETRLRFSERVAAPRVHFLMDFPFSSSGPDALVQAPEVVVFLPPGVLLIQRKLQLGPGDLKAWEIGAHWALKSMRNLAGDASIS